MKEITVVRMILVIDLRGCSPKVFLAFLTYRSVLLKVFFLEPSIVHIEQIVEKQSGCAPI